MKIGMRLCGRCRGSGSLLRPNSGKPPRSSFMICPKCKGSGVRIKGRGVKGFAPRTIMIHTVS